MFSSMIPKPSVASARNTPDSRMAGMAMTAPTGTTMSAASNTARQPRDAVVAHEVSERGGADRREPELRERHLTGQADEQAERQEQHDVHHGDRSRPRASGRRCRDEHEEADEDAPRRRR